MHIEEPVWLDDAYACAITSSDTGLMERNHWFANVSSAIISVLFDASGRFIDYGGGEGVYTSLMRQKGYNFFWYDKFAENLYSGPFEADLTGSLSYELLTAVELFEHLMNPKMGIAEMLRHSPNILFTTHLLPDAPPPIGKWWYYGLEHGQHVSFYSRKTLEYLAGIYNLSLTTNGRNLHLFSKKKLPEKIFRLLTSTPAVSLIKLFGKRPSLVSGEIQKEASKENKDANRP